MMKVSLKTGAAALVAVLGILAGAGSATAQIQAPQTQASPEQVRLGVQFAEQVLSIIDLNTLLSKQMATTFAGSDGEIFKIEPKWRDFFVEAMGEEFRADHAAIAAVLGRALAKTFTTDELKAGLTVFRDPAMPAVMKALQAGQPAPQDVTLQPATLQAIATPAGQSLAAKFKNIGPVMEQANGDFVHVLLPGFFQRFSDKAMALERQRRQAENLPPIGG